MEFLADLTTLNGIMNHLRSEASAQGMDEKTIHKMELACEEAIVNIVSYAYPERKGPISIVCGRNGRRFEITLCDQGIPFNPIDADVNPELDAPVTERPIGGLGLFLIRKVIDEASYQRTGDQNILKLTFTI
jgi:serine/threonine-protein kinase RsbW